MVRSRLLVVGIVMGLLGPLRPAVANPSRASVRPIVFSDNGIARVDPDGSRREVIVTPSADARIFQLPDLSPDGSQVVFRECDTTSVTSLVCWLNVVNLDGSGLRRVTGQVGGYAPRWAPDNHRIAFSQTRNRKSEVVVVDADKPGSQVIAEGAQPDWSPDGSTIVFSGPPPGEPDEDSMYRFNNRGVLYVVPADGSSAPRPLTPPLPYRPKYPVWSPDGTTIAFLANDDDRKEPKIQLVDARGAAPRAAWFAQDPDRFFSRPAWSPDSGSLVASLGNVSGANPLYTFDMRRRCAIDQKFRCWKKIMDDDGVWVAWS